MTPDTLAILAILGVLLLGLGSLLVAWRATATAERWRERALDAQLRASISRREAGELRRLVAGGQQTSYSRTEPRPAPDATREMRIVRDAT